MVLYSAPFKATQMLRNVGMNFKTTLQKEDKTGY